MSVPGGLRRSEAGAHREDAGHGGLHRHRLGRAAEAGLAPVTRQSGGSRRVPFRYAANHHLRAIWRQWMLTVIRISPWTRAAHDAARARGQSHSRAVRSVGARWGRIPWRCWQDGVPYDPALDRRVQLAEAA